MIYGTVLCEALVAQAKFNVFWIWKPLTKYYAEESNLEHDDS